MKKFLIEIYTVFLWAIDSLYLLFRENNSNKSDSVLLVRVDNIGDFVLWLSSVDQIRKKFNDKKLILVANKSFSELAKDTGYFDQVIAVDVHKFTYSIWYRWNMMSRVSKLNPRIAIQPCYSRNFHIGDSLIRVSNATNRVGSVGDLNNISVWQKAISDRWYTCLNSSSNKLLMELERDAEFLSDLDIKVEGLQIPQLPTLSKLPKKLNITEDYFIIFPGASWVGRKWMLSSFAEIGMYITREYGYKMVLCGIQSEFKDAEIVIENSLVDGAINLAGKTTLSQFCELVRGAKLLIGNDTSAVHIAAAVNTRSICLLGGGHYGRFMPYPSSIRGVKPIPVFSKMDCYNCNWRCTQVYDKGKAVPCITNIKVADVVFVVKNILSKAKVERI